MDYDFRIQLLEKELAHMREMQALMRLRQDTSDARFEHIETILARVAEQQATTAKHIDMLVDAITRERPNGKH